VRFAVEDLAEVAEPTAAWTRSVIAVDRKLSSPRIPSSLSWTRAA